MIYLMRCLNLNHFATLNTVRVRVCYRRGLFFSFIQQRLLITITLGKRKQIYQILDRASLLENAVEKASVATCIACTTTSCVLSVKY